MLHKIDLKGALSINLYDQLKVFHIKYGQRPVLYHQTLVTHTHKHDV